MSRSGLRLGDLSGLRLGDLTGGGLSGGALGRSAPMGRCARARRRPICPRGGGGGYAAAMIPASPCAVAGPTPAVTACRTARLRAAAPWTAGLGLAPDWAVRSPRMANPLTSKAKPAPTGQSGGFFPGRGSPALRAWAG